MKTGNFICILLLIVLFGCTKDDNTNEPLTFPDELFEKYLLSHFDTDGDGQINAKEASVVKEIDCSRMNLISIKGIQYFTALEKLNCSGNNKLRDLDVSRNPALQVLNCSSCFYEDQLGILDLSKNTNLKELYCNNNRMIDAIDISNSTSLEILDCSSCSFSTLDLSKNTALKKLYYNYNKIGSIDISNLTNLEELYCNNSQTGSLDISNLANLKKLYFSTDYYECSLTGLNQVKSSIEEIKLDNIKTDKELDFSNSNLKSFHYTDAGIETLNLSGCDKLESVTVSQKSMSYLEGTIHLNGCKSLTFFHAKGNFDYPDLSACVSLKELYILDRYTDRSALDISKCTELETAIISASLLSVTNNKKLKTLNCNDVLVDILDLTNLPLLEELVLRYTNASLNINNNKLLRSIIRNGDDKDKITNISIVDCPLLETIEIPFGHRGIINRLEIKGCPLLNKINFNQDKRGDDIDIHTINISDCISLKELNCKKSKIQNLNLSVNNLTYLDCTYNLLKSLDVSACSNLNSLYCTYNPELEYVYMHSGQHITDLRKPDYTTIIYKD